MRTLICFSVVRLVAACGPEEIDNAQFDADGDADAGNGGTGAMSGIGGTGGTSGTGGVGDDMDAGEGSGMDSGPDASACAVTCDGATPHCDVTSMTSVACLETPDCANAAGKVCTDGACVECTGSEGCPSPEVCITTGHDCVACNVESDCNTATKCNLTTNQCVLSANNTQCTGVTDGNVTLDVCNQGVCVRCTVADETACAGNSCDLATKTCTNTSLARVQPCEESAADSECAGRTYRCVPMNFMGTPRVAGYCLRLQSVGRTRPFSAAIVRESLSGGASDAYCTIAKNLASCEAVLDMMTGRIARLRRIVGLRDWPTVSVKRLERSQQVHVRVRRRKPVFWQPYLHGARTLLSLMSVVRASAVSTPPIVRSLRFFVRFVRNHSRHPPITSHLKQ